MTIKIRAENRDPSIASQNIINEVASIVGSSLSNKAHWFYQYAKDHHHRLAFDIDYIKE